MPHLINQYLYRGRHRSPSTAARTAARCAVVGMVGTSTLALVDVSATADTLDEIARCESSGNPQATNGSHFGLYQFDMATWRSVGGSGNPMNASAAEQRTRAAALMAARGTQPWLASQHCWGGRVSTVRKVAPAPAKTRPVAAAPRVRTAAAPRPRPVAPTPARRAAVGAYTVRSGDTLSGIAVVYHTSWHKLWDANRGQVRNPDRIYPRQRINVR